MRGNPRSRTVCGHVVSILAVSACATPAGDVRNDVRCREIAFSRAAEARNASAFSTFLDADARFVAASVTRGPAEIVPSWQPFFAPGGPSIKWRPEVVEVLEDGSLALSRGPYRVTAKDADGKTVDQWGTFNSVWRLHGDGNWRIVFDAGSPSAGQPSEAHRALLAAADDCDSG